MAPQNHIMKFEGRKGGYGHKIYFPKSKTDSTTIPTTIQEMLTTAINSASSTVQNVLNPRPNEENNTNINPGADENSLFNVSIPAEMNNTSNFAGITTSTGTSFVEVTTTLLDEMQMEHTGEEEQNYILFVILGVVLGILVLVAVVLGVIYNNYRKRGFEEIAGDHGSVDAKSMKQLQQASSQDALLNK